MMKKVLIVDDKADNLYLLETILKMNGHVVSSTSNGLEALKKLKNELFDLIISDILMPVMDGFTLCRECKKDSSLKHIPFVFYTATYKDPKDEEYALNLGADLFILKPQEPDVFIDIINNFLKEVEKKDLHPKEITQQSETIILKEYNEVLVRKIEDKMLQSERSEAEIKKYAEKLETEILEHKKSVESLQRSEEYNRLLFNSSPIGLVLCKMDGSFIDINPAYAKITGRTIEETQKFNFWELISQKHSALKTEILNRLEETNAYGKFENEYIHKDGHTVPVLIQGLILLREGERLIWSCVEDITDRKKIEIDLQNSQHLFQTLAEVSPVGIFRTTPEGETTYVNPKWTEIAGLTLHEAVGENWTNAIHPEDREKVVNNWKDDLESRNKSHAEYRFLKKNGNIVWVMGNAVPEFINNRIVGYIGTITDITDLKLAEESINHERRLLRTLIDNIPDVIYVKDLNCRKIIANKSDVRNSGAKEEVDVLGKTDIELFPGQTGQRGYSDDKKVIILGNSIVNIEEDFVDYNGIRRWLLTTKIPLLDKYGIISGLVGIGHDITERKQFEQELINAKNKAEESDRLKTAFLHNISHEVRTPMNAIVGFSDLLSDPDLPPSIRNEFTETIVRSSNQLLTIITQIVSMATLETGQEKIYSKEVSLNSILGKIFDQFKDEAGRKNILLKNNNSIPESDHLIITDESKLTQILSNLLGNALKFTKTGSIDFGYSLKKEDLEFYVKDTGIGIPEDLQDKIFERFRQVETTLAREYEGAGLGLSISKAYVELLGGKIWVTSSLGNGSSFYFTIPYNKSKLDKPRSKRVKINNQLLSEKNIVLIAEDEPDNFKLIEQYLLNTNIDLLHASNGKEAIDICKSNKEIKLVLMDLKMPVMDGFEASQKIKEFRNDLIIIAQTAYDREVDKIKAFSSGCTDFISKPFNRKELLSIISRHIVI
jgi:PAS domain S-box-containing protein